MICVYERYQLPIALNNVYRLFYVLGASAVNFFFYLTGKQPCELIHNNHNHYTKLTTFGFFWGGGGGLKWPQNW